jgi:molybdenum cofactor guanylyltransferase
MFPLYIMAGGQSRRFGRDKSRALIDGKPLILHVVESLSDRCARVSVVTDMAGKYDDLGLRSLADFRPGAGPLAGLERALADLRPDETWLLMVSCDFVGAQAAWLEQLLAKRDEAMADEKHVIAFAKEGRFEPLFALYHGELLKTVRRRLESGQAAMHGLLNAAGLVAVPYPSDWASAVNVNTPEDLRQATRIRE